MRRWRWAWVAVLLATMPAGADWVRFPHTGQPLEIRDDDIQASADQMRCIQTKTIVGLANATQIAVRTGGTAPTGVLGVAIYDETGQTKLTKGTYAGSWATDTTVTIVPSPQPFTVAANTSYLWCWCLSTTTGHFIFGSNIAGTIFADIWNVSEDRFGTAGNSCSTGVPPETVGGLADVTTDPPPLLAIIGDASE